jgi:fibronectin type 3 domain-containing protein
VRALLSAVLILVATLGFSQIIKQDQSYLDQIKFRDSGLGVKNQPVYLPQALPFLANKTSWQAFLQRNPGVEAYVDANTGMPVLVNGSGNLWIQASPFQPGMLNQTALKARSFMQDNSGIFQNLPLQYLQLNSDRSGPLGDDGYLYFIDFDFIYEGVPIEGARVVFRCNHGNMVQFGVEGIVPFAGGAQKLLDPIPSVSAPQAMDIAYNYAGGLDDKNDSVINPGSLKFVPRLLASAGQDFTSRYEFPLVWEVAFHRDGIAGTWTIWVDAHSGQVISFWDGNDYGVVKGGVYPVSQTVSTEVKRGLPFVDVNTSVYTNWAGKYTTPTSGSTVSKLQGKYVKIVDSCGSVSLSGTAPNDIDFGSSSGTDCTTPGVGGSGNTHAARSCFYHIGNIKYKASQWLPSNTWLTGQLTANMNLNQTCNAYWNGSSINFFRSGGGCGNTGEIAAIFLHEFAHGLDSNDGGTTSDKASGEVYGDTTGFLQTHNSCGGPGFLGSNCDGYGDACTSCTGVREADYAKHSSGTAHNTLSFVKNNCPSSSSYYGPCGKEGHCEAIPGIETLWDLANRDLITQGLDSATSWFVLDRLFFLSRPTSGSMYTCSSYTASGCSASNWHQTFLVVDDNDGNLTNGTPHGGSIKNAFTRHGLACSTSTSTNSTTCAALTAPTVTATAGNNSVGLSWAAITNAAKYFVMRNDLGCDNGYIKVAETTATSYTDGDVANGMTYYYRVVAVASTASCFSNLSACKTVTPTSGGSPTYVISGTITNGSGATVNLSGAATASTTADGSGNYSFAGLANGTYTVTPAKTGCTFSPTSTSVTISGADQTGKNFTAACGGSTDTQLTSGVGVAGSVAQGAWAYYCITVPSGATQLVFATTGASGDVDIYTQVTNKPTSSSYVCRPYTSNGNETCTQASPTAGTWWCGVYGYAAGSFTITATVTTGTATYSISGTITNGASATVNLSGTAAATTTADASGNYSFAGLANGGYTVTPSKSGCTFSPTSLAVTISGANQTGKNFTATCGGGGDTQLTSGVPVTGQSVTQGAWKYYYITVPSGATSLVLATSAATGDVDIYTQVTNKPTSSSYVCRPYGSSGNETCTQANPTVGTWWLGVYGYAAASFTVTGTVTMGGTTYSISGTVSGATASGVTMTLAGAGTGTQTTDASGNYTFSGLVNGAYTVTPSKSGYTFSPSSLAVTVSGANQTGKNFTATASGSCNANAASFATLYQAPACIATGKSCTTGTSLINCASISESNYPNTVNDSCADGTGEACSTTGDEFVKQITIATNDGSCLAAGKAVTITVVVDCYDSGPSSDKIAAYYATTLPGTGSPTWTKVGSTISCGSAGPYTATFTTTLSGTAGAAQAVRAQMVYNTDPSTNACYTGTTYADRDDLVFKLQ